MSQEVYQLDQREPKTAPGVRRTRGPFANTCKRASPEHTRDGIRGARELNVGRMLTRRRRERRLTQGSIVERKLDAQGRAPAEGAMDRDRSAQRLDAIL
jgi:hypothetical protein